jgi:KxDL motif-containing protein 1
MNRIDVTNKNLVQTNQQSQEILNAYAIKDYTSYINLLKTMKQDLDSIFKRIKLIKNKLNNKYPANYKDGKQNI